MGNKSNDFCSKNFKFNDFVSCSETYQNSLVENEPFSKETFDFISQLANDILEPCLLEFGNLKLTYGFCGSELAKFIKKGNGGIYPPLDQHAGMEVNKFGDLICPRGGMAADFHCLPRSSLEVAKFIVEKLPFDRLYFYGADRPVHVSVNKELTSQVVLMQKARIKIVPRRINKSDFLSL